jgi:hypothetical protein
LSGALPCRRQAGRSLLPPMPGCPDDEGRRLPIHTSRRQSARTAPRSPQCAARAAAAASERADRTRDGGALNVPCAHLAKSATRTFEPPNGSVARRKTTFRCAMFDTAPTHLRDPEGTEASRSGWNFTDSSAWKAESRPLTSPIRCRSMVDVERRSRQTRDRTA